MAQPREAQPTAKSLRSAGWEHGLQGIALKRLQRVSDFSSHRSREQLEWDLNEYCGPQEFDDNAYWPSTRSVAFHLGCLSKGMGFSGHGCVVVSASPVDPSKFLVCVSTARTAVGRRPTLFTTLCRLMAHSGLFKTEARFFGSFLSPESSVGT